MKKPKENPIQFQQPVFPVKFATFEDAVNAMKRWLHDHNCAVCVWTPADLGAADSLDIEGAMYEIGSESIEQNQHFYDEY